MPFFFVLFIINNLTQLKCSLYSYKKLKSMEKFINERRSKNARTNQNGENS